MDRLRLNQPIPNQYQFAFSDDALDFLEALATKYNARVTELLAARRVAAAKVDAGELPDFAPETADIRAGDWQVADCPPQLANRKVEITAPAERKKIIQALNSDADAYMADFEDSLTPSWENITSGQAALYEACRGACELTDERGKHYALKSDHSCILIIRPRGWHLAEKNVLLDGQPIAGALLDFGIFVFNNAKVLAERGRGAYFYLPKTEHWREAALWNEVMDFAEQYLGLPASSCKATLLIETLPAAFQMHEILYAMRTRLVGLNCGRWDYIFSYIKTLKNNADRVLPERNVVTMEQPFLRAYALELIKTCHQRNAHAMGGMSAFIPIRGDESANQAAFDKVRADKQREASFGHDGTWVAHPGLIPLAKEVFDEHIAGDNQKNIIPTDAIRASDLLAPSNGEITLDGVDNNIQVTLRYMSAWLGGSGAVPIFNLMEDAATAEISRAQLWQWIKFGSAMSDGSKVTESLFRERLAHNQQQIETEWREQGNPLLSQLAPASQLFSDIVLASDMADFLTLSAYEQIS